MSMVFLSGLPRDGRDPVHGVHPPPVLHLPGPVLRHRQPAPALLPARHHPQGRPLRPGGVGAQPHDRVSPGLHRDLLLRGASQAVQVGWGI